MVSFTVHQAGDSNRYCYCPEAFCCFPYCKHHKQYSGIWATCSKFSTVSFQWLYLPRRSCLDYKINKQLSGLFFVHPQREFKLVSPSRILKHLALHRRHLTGAGPMAADTAIQMHFWVTPANSTFAWAAQADFVVKFRSATMKKAKKLKEGYIHKLPQKRIPWCSLVVRKRKWELWFQIPLCG